MLARRTDFGPLVGIAVSLVFSPGQARADIPKAEQPPTQGGPALGRVTDEEQSGSVVKPDAENPVSQSRAVVFAIQDQR